MVARMRLDLAASGTLAAGDSSIENKHHWIGPARCEHTQLDAHMKLTSILANRNNTAPNIQPVDGGFGVIQRSVVSCKWAVRALAYRSESITVFLTDWLRPISTTKYIARLTQDDPVHLLQNRFQDLAGLEVRRYLTFRCHVWTH